MSDSAVAEPGAVVVGAGPAGAALALILASRGVPTTLVERQADFAREFRGEVVMPGGWAVLEQMGLGPGLDALPQRRPDSLAIYHRRRERLRFEIGAGGLGEDAAPRIVSQPHLLELLVAEAGRQRHFRFVRGGAVRALEREGGRVCGARIRTRGGEELLRARLVIGADGRASVVRRQLAPRVRTLGTPMDVVWCKLPWPESFGETQPVRGYFGGGHLLITLPAPDGLLQVAWVILKGTYGELRSRGVEQWVHAMADHVSGDLAAHLRAHGHEISRPFLLAAATDRVQGWAHPGALLVGDAAHTMSPVGGQGINVALRDAVVAANHLVPVLREGAAPEAVDRAAARVEAERGAEIDRIQSIAALPPRVVMRRGWAAEILRALVPWLVRTPLGRRAAAPQIELFLSGAAPAARLRV